MKNLALKIFTYTKEFFMILIGVLLASFGLKGFLIPNGFIDGGVTGISLLISYVTPLHLPLLLFVINLPFIILARKQIGKTFAIKSLFAIISLALILLFVHFPTITTDKLLVAIFGGFLLGAGIGFSIRGGSVLDGTEILSVFLNRKSSFSVGEIILFINLIIFSFALLFLRVEIILYSLLTYLVASKAVDFVSHGIEEYKSLTIISDKHEKIKQELINMHKGVTIYYGEKGNSANEEKIKILFTVVTRLEVFKLKIKILEIDPKALIIEDNILDFQGGYIKKRKPRIKG